MECALKSKLIPPPGSAEIHMNFRTALRCSNFFAIQSYASRFSGFFLLCLKSSNPRTFGEISSGSGTYMCRYRPHKSKFDTFLKQNTVLREISWFWDGFRGKNIQNNASRCVRMLLRHQLHSQNVFQQCRIVYR